MFRKIHHRSRVRLVKSTGYVDLPTACVRANQTGFFALQQRVAPESFDGNDTNINPSDCFFGGRRIDLALTAKRAEDYANRQTRDKGVSEPPTGDGTSSGESPES